jgi:DNA repair exonuclease SbcCD ATPase subunit
MEERKSTIVSSLNDEIWEAYLEKFAKESTDFLLEKNARISIIKNNPEKLKSVLETDVSSTAFLVFWPLEVLPLLVSDVKIQPAVVNQWVNSVSHYLKLRHEFKDRLFIINGIHLFSDFAVEEFPEELCSENALFDSSNLGQYLLAKDEVAEYPDYVQSADLIHALESNSSHGKLRYEKFSVLRSEYKKILFEAFSAKEKLPEIEFEYKSSKSDLEKQSEIKALVSQENAQLKQQVLLLQEALEKQFAKSNQASSIHLGLIEEKESKFLAECDDLKRTIENLKVEKLVEVEEKRKLEDRIQEKEKTIAYKAQELISELEHNASLQEQLVQVQIHIEKIHAKFSAQLRESDSKLEIKEREAEKKIQESKQAIERVLEKETHLTAELLEVKRALEETQTQLTKKTRLLEVSLKEQHLLTNEIANKTKSLLQESMQKQRIEQKYSAKVKNLEQALAISEGRRNISDFELNQIKDSRYWKLLAPAKHIKSRILGSEKDIKQDMALLYTSNLFDIDWYLGRYKDVVESGLDPAEHYLKFGYKEGRNPGPNFDGNWYLQHYSDVAKRGMNPLIHFIKYGEAEGRRSSPRLLGRS